MRRRQLQWLWARLAQLRAMTLSRSKLKQARRREGRELMLSRYTQPEPEPTLLLERLQFALPAQPPPGITATQAATAHAV